MKGNFDQCLAWLLAHEGGFVNHPDDPGGMTNKGITARVYSQWLADAMDVDAEITEEVMRNIPDAHVEYIYRQEYWNRVAGDKLPAGLDWFVFDWAVNSGVGRSARTLQKIIGVTADGGIGPQTLAAVASHDPDVLIEDMYHRRQAFYERLKTFETFGAGWTRRNDETREQSLELCHG
jgi:lysozyme family protein